MMNREKQELIEELASKMAVNDLMYDYRVRAITEFADSLEKLFARRITPKMKEAEEYVRYYIKVHEKPPTYKLVSLNLGIGRTAAFARLRHCRELMERRQ